MINQITLIQLKPFDGDAIDVDINIAKMFNTIANLIENCDTSKTLNPVPLQHVSSESLKKMIKFAELHQNDLPMTEEAASKELKRTFKLKGEDKKFVDNLNMNELCDLIIAANFLDFKLLLDVLCKSVALMMKDRTIDEIREVFNIKNDFTEEEELKIREENSWLEKFSSKEQKD